MFSISVLSVNYKKTSVNVRSKFALTSVAIKKIYQNSSTLDIDNFFILSTCNRTEIYSSSKDYQKLKSIFLLYTKANDKEVEDYVVVKKDREAIHHLFKVASGLESQILGDYEIIGQLKTAMSLAKAENCVGGYLEKVVNTALQASKAVRNQTNVSDGTTSVSYAVIQLIKDVYSSEEHKAVCLLGLGKIGLNTLLNLKSYCSNQTITVVNRNEEKAKKITQEHGVNYRPFGKQREVIDQSDILIVATGADQPIVTKDMLSATSVKIVFDLSVPSNVSTDVADLKDITLYDVDTLSHTVNLNLKKREQDVPKALDIIDRHIEELIEWQIRKIKYTICNTCDYEDICEILDSKNWNAQ